MSKVVWMIALAIIALAFFAGLTNWGHHLSWYEVIVFLAVVGFIVGIHLHSRKLTDG